MPARRIIPLFIPHVGCPHQCVFCNQRRIAADGPITPEDTALELERALGSQPQGSEAEVAFYGGSFTAIEPDLRRAYLEAVRPFLLSGQVSSVRLSTRPDCVDKGILDELEAYGVRTIELGAQSMADTILALAGRGHTAADTHRAAALIRARGFELVLQMMCHLPGSSDADDLHTAEELAELRPQGVRVYPAVVIEGTPLAEMWRAGEYEPPSLERSVALCAGLLRLFHAADVPVIRVGLNPTEELSGGAALAGVYHPAFGELVRSRVYIEAAREILRSGHPDGGKVKLLVAPGMTSAMVGHRRENVLALERQFGLKGARVRESEGVGMFEVLVESTDN